VSDLCRDLHEWPQHPLQGGIEFFASAAIFVLRARAAQNLNDCIGL